MSLRFAITILCLGCQFAPILADEPRAIDAETVAAYEKLGAKHGGFKTNECGHLVFSEGINAAQKGLPGFRFYGPNLFENDKLPKLPPVAVPFGLEFFGPTITDAGLKKLKEHKTLVHLGIVFSDITDAGLKELKDFNNLKSFDIGSLAISNAGLKHFKEAKSLTHLGLVGTSVTDKGLKELKALRGLTSLNLTFTVVTDKGVNELQKALPKCLILFN